MAASRLPPPEASALWRHIQEIDPYPNWWSLLPPTRELYPSMRRGVTPARNPHGAFLRVLGNDLAIQGADKNGLIPRPGGRPAGGGRIEPPPRGFSAHFANPLLLSLQL
jgi:hypothetical protein